MVTLKELSERVTVETRSLLNRITKNKKDADSKFSSANTRIDGTNTRIDDTNTRVDTTTTALNVEKNRLTTLEQDLAVKLYDSGTIPITFILGVSGYGASYQKLGDQVELDGGVGMSGLAAGVFHVVAKLPVDFRPTKYQYYTTSAPLSTAVASLRIQTNGNIEIHISVATTTNVMLTGVRFRSTKPIV